MPKKNEPGIETIRTTTAHHIEGASCYGEVELHAEEEPTVTISVGALRETAHEKLTMSVEKWVHVANFILDIAQQLEEADGDDDNKE